jgi:hypothetical protein
MSDSSSSKLRPSSPIAVLLALASLLAAAPASAADRPLASLEVEPAFINLDSARSAQQVVVTGRFLDGSTRDLTRESALLMDGSVADVSRAGLVTPGQDGDGHLVVRALGQSVTVPVRTRGASLNPPVSYRVDVAAILSKAGCNMGACHGNINGKGGFRLSLRGDDPSADFLALTRDTLGRRVDRTRAAESLIVLKPTGRLPHEGGLRFEPGSVEARALLGWIEAGATDDRASAPRVVRLRAFPEHRLNAFPGLTQQLAVTAEFSDGTRRDVTRQVAFDVNDPTKVSVGPDGLVASKGPGETTVAVRYLTGRAVSRLAFLPDRPGFVARPVPLDNPVDRHVFAKLNALKITPADPTPDLVFLRRAYLDAIGIPPTPEEARAFLADPDPARRSKVVDRLLTRPEFADFWALKWADLLRNEEKTMGDKGVWVFQRWLRDQIAADVPLDEFARRIVSAKGSTYLNPPASFYRTNRDPQTAAETVGQVFLGVRLQCARCHNHPFDVWTQDDYYGLAAYFGNVGRKILDPDRKDSFDKHEINGDVIIHLAGRPEMVQPRSGQMMQPKPPGGRQPVLRDDPNALDDLADWLTRDNPQFARNMANRVWFHLMGRGIVEPVDDFRDSNPPSNPALLDALTDEFRASGFRLRPLVALIMKSRAYAYGSETNETNADDEANFSRAAVKLLPAEVLLDSVGQALGKPSEFRNLPPGMRAAQLPGVNMGGNFLRTFGKPDRLLTCECERSETTTLAQAFQLLNGEAIRDKLEAPENRLGLLIASGTTDEAIADELGFAILGRPLNASEKADLLAHVAQAKDRRKGWEDAAWALINTKEFLLRH